MPTERFQFPGTDGHLLAAALDPPTHERLRSAGIDRAAGFTWQRTAKLVDAVVDELLGPG